MTAETNGPGREPTRDDVVLAQHEETGRMWTGPRGAIPRRYHEVAAPPAAPPEADALAVCAKVDALALVSGPGPIADALFALRSYIEQQARELAELRTLAEACGRAVDAAREMHRISYRKHDAWLAFDAALAAIDAARGDK